MSLQHNQNPEQVKFISFLFLGMLFIILLLFLASCRTIEVPYQVKTVREVFRDIHTRDSIWVHDSIYVREMADTVFIEKWHTKYIEKLKIDSVIKIDSIPTPYEVIKTVKVEKKLSFIQNVQMELGKYCGIFIISLIVIWFFKSKIKLF